MKKKLEGIFGSIRMYKDLYIEKFLLLYKDGLNDTEISKALGITYSTICRWRNDRNLPKNFNYSVKFDINEFYKLYNSGLNYTQIAKELNVSDSAILAFALKNNLQPNKYIDFDFTEEEYQILLGTLLGDGHLQIPSDCVNAKGGFAHSDKLLEYCKWKYSKLARFSKITKLYEVLDKRTKKYYKRIDVTFKSHPNFTKLYYKLYNNGVKYINEDLLSTLKPLGIAVWFMDDGYYDHGSCSIATNCFSDEDLLCIVNFFKFKYDLQFHIYSNHIIRLIKADFNKFKTLILPYMHYLCLYKFGPDAPKTPLNKENPIEDNLVLNLQETEEKAKRLEVMPNE